MSTQLIEYIAHMGDDLMVVNCARVSFGKVKKVLDSADEQLIEYLATGLRRAERNDLIRSIINAESSEDANVLIDRIQSIQKHWAPFAHPQIQFRIECSISVARQLHKHHIGMIVSEESRRYIDNSPEMTNHQSLFRKRAADVKQGSGDLLEYHDMVFANSIYREAADDSDRAYRKLLAIGVAPEQARDVLTVGSLTTWICTGSLYAWANLCRQRLDPHAQKESGEIALIVAAICRELFPVSWKALLRD